MSAIQMLRSCSSSFSSRSARNAAFAVRRQGASRRLAPSGARSYSDTPKTEEGQSSSEPGKTESAAKEAEQQPSPDAEKLKAKEAEIADLTSRLRYQQADFLNLQRNAAREKEQQRDFAITKFATDLLETADVLNLALKSIPKEAIASAAESSSSSTPSGGKAPKSAEQYLRDLYTGVELTQRQLQQTLFKYQVKSFDPTGDKFDPNMHEALYQAPIPGKEPGTVIDCQKIGYMIKDRVLRAAQVGVAQETS